ncbi:hypothetical protein GALL_132460 [mine drainage metagenome]|uniref:PilZ domain-containing protein n=1 Tax=mine drainage metagenome TaxID=410659 RepID=A0A1J5SKN3_9ZZZZ
MALNLNLPMTTASSMIIAETNPRKIGQLLANIDGQNPLDIASYLYIELEILNRQKVSPNDRIQALDAYRPLLINTAQALAVDYSNAALPLHDNAKVAAAAAESLWLELGYGYKLALVDLQNKLIKIGTNKISAHVIQHAMHAIAEHALVHYQTYLAPPEHIWGDLHQLYFCAVQLGIQNVNVGLFPYPNFSIENSYVHALLMYLSDPQHLTQKDIRLAADFLAHHIGKTQITAVIPLESTSGAFIISLKSNKPPTPYSKQKDAPNPSTDILLQTIDLVRTIHQLLNNLLNNQWPKDGSIPIDGNRNDFIGLLTHLIKYWGIIPKRIFSRSQKNGELELVVGISDIYHASNHNNSTTTGADIDTNINTTVRQILPINPSRWQILNISAAGMSIRRHPTANKNIRIGCILGIKTKNETQWSLGLVRWASCGNRDRLDIGVQLIAPQAQSAIASINGREHNEMVLLLPEIPAANQAATIIAPKGTFEPARSLTLTYNNVYQHIMLTKLIEHSNHFERIQYSQIN